MSKRTPDAPPRPQSFWRTPPEAVIPLLIEIGFEGAFAEPCCGDGALVNALEKFGWRCRFAGDIRRRGKFRRAVLQDGRRLSEGQLRGIGGIITNPPWTPRPLLHELIDHWSGLRPTWLLLDAAWAHTDQAVRFSRRCRKIVSAGRVSWMDNGRNGYDDAAWYLFDAQRPGPCEYVFRRK